MIIALTVLATMAYLALGIAAIGWLRPDLLNETAAALLNLATWPLGIAAQLLWFRRPWYRRYRAWRRRRIRK
jgi:hypothetical protein